MGPSVVGSVVMGREPGKVYWPICPNTLATAGTSTGA